MAKLATIRTAEGTRAVQLVDGLHVDLGYADLGAWLAAGSPAPASDAAVYPTDGADFAPVVPNPSKVICVGHNYKNHIQEMGRELPSYPTLFPKFAETLIGAYDDVVKPAETDALDWEVELAIVIGKPVRRADEEQAAAAIAGFTVMNDISVRDWQFRTIEWTQGKIWDSSTPVGPYVVTPDELPGGVRPALEPFTLPARGGHGHEPPRGPGGLGPHRRGQARHRRLRRQVHRAFSRDALDASGNLCVERVVAACDDDRLPAASKRQDEAKQAVRSTSLRHFARNALGRRAV